MLPLITHSNGGCSGFKPDSLSHLLSIIAFQTASSYIGIQLRSLYHKKKRFSIHNFIFLNFLRKHLDGTFEGVNDGQMLGADLLTSAAGNAGVSPVFLFGKLAVFFRSLA